MAKKKRKKNSTLYGVVEGDREQFFLSILIEIYDPRNNGINFNFVCSSGGTPDRIVRDALNQSHRDKAFAWLDEDFEPDTPLGEDIRRRLAECWGVSDEDLQDFLDCSMSELQKKYNPNNKRKPTLIVSSPICSDSVLLLVLGEALPFEKYDPSMRDRQIQAAKSKLNNLIRGQDEIEFYRDKLSRDILEDKRKEIPQLNLLLSMISK